MTYDDCRPPDHSPKVEGCHKVNMKSVCKGKVHPDDISSITMKYIDDGSGWDADF